MFFKAVGQVLREDGHVVYCQRCKSAFRNGPTACPRCNGPLVDASTFKPITAPAPTPAPASTVPKEAHVFDSKAEVTTISGGRFVIIYQGATLSPELWAGRTGCDLTTLLNACKNGHDVTPVLRREIGPRAFKPVAPAATPSPASSTGDVAEVHREGFGRGSRYTITFRGKTKSPREWADELGLNIHTLMYYVNQDRDVSPYMRGEGMPRKNGTAVAPSAPAVPRTPEPPEPEPEEEPEEDLESEPEADEGEAEEVDEAPASTGPVPSAPQHLWAGARCPGCGNYRALRADRNLCGECIAKADGVNHELPTAPIPPAPMTALDIPRAAPVAPKIVLMVDEPPHVMNLRRKLAELDTINVQLAELSTRKAALIAELSKGGMQ